MRLSLSQTSRLLTGLVALGFVAYFWLQGRALLAVNSQTFDEGVHLVAGYSYLATGDFRVNSDDPPFIKLLWGLPLYLGDRPVFNPPPELWDDPNHWLIAEHFLDSVSTHPEELLYPARLVNLTLGCALVGLIGWWGYRLWGRTGGLTAMAFAAFDPNLQAHSCILSTDVGLTLFATLTCYLAWEYLRAPSHPRLIGLGVALGLALASKFSAVILLPILGAILLIRIGRGGAVTMPGVEVPPGTPFRTRLAQAIGPVIRVGVVALSVVAACYFIVGFPTWAAGLKQQLVRTHEAGSFYFLGEVSSQGWWLYFPVALAIKSPLGTLVAVALSLALWRLATPRAENVSPRVAILLVPPLLYLVAMMYSGIDIGVRVILPVFPFLFLIAGRLATVPRFGVVLAGVSLLLTLGSAARVTPHQLTYFNESIGGPAQGWRYLGDSNLDWGQGLTQLRDYLDRQGIEAIYLSYYGTAKPEDYGIRFQYLPGYGRVSDSPAGTVSPDDPQILAISVSNLQGIYLSDPDMYRWLLEREPITKISNSIYVYDITNDPQGRDHLRAILTGGNGAEEQQVAEEAQAHHPATFWPPRDFLEYWAAGRLNGTGGDPYAAEELLRVQQTYDPTLTRAVMMWNPPWTLPLITPWGLPSVRVGQAGWIGLQFACVLVGAWLLWRVYAPATERQIWLPLALAVTFAPTVFLLKFGQIGGLPFLGLVGFLVCIRSDRPYLAGVLGALTAVKPHLFPVFALALLCEGIMRPSGRKVIASGVLTLMGLTLLAWLINPQLFTQYREALNRPLSPEHVPLEGWRLPTIGYWLRVAIPGQPFWVQFMPALVALLALIPYYALRWRTWNWDVELPRIVFLSLLTACYGAWPFDLVPLLLMVIPVAIRLRSVAVHSTLRLAAGVYLIVNLLALRPGIPAESFVWITPTVGLAYVLVMRRDAVRPE